MALNQCQEKAKKALVHYILGQPEENEIILSGCAGTGKTYTLKEVMAATQDAAKLLRLAGSDLPRLNWILTATTNKAKEVLAKQFPLFNVKTIHSALGLVPKGKRLIQANAVNIRSDCLNIVVIDECSYVNEELMSYIDALPAQVKVIYLGDECQLAPVGYNKSPVFAKEDIQVLELQEQMRQAGSQQLQDYCNELVAFIKSGGTCEFPKLHLCDQLQHVSSKEFEDLIYDEFIIQDKSTQDYRILSYSNKVVNHHNAQLFAAKTGRSEFKVGDTVLNNYYVSGIATDAQVTIVGMSPVRVKGIYIGDRCLVEDTTTGITANLFVPHDRDQTKRLLDGNILHYEVLLDTMADLRPMYACTVHKSQGSTFDTVFLDLSSFRYVKDDVSLARLLYVAISRAKTKVIMTGDIQ